MARTEITVQEFPTAFEAFEELTWTAGDIVNLNSFKATGREIMFIRNDDASSQDTVVQSVDDRFGRSENETVSAPAADYFMKYFNNTEGWLQSDGMIYFDPADADLFYAIVKLP